jgi:5'-nucleotidase
MTPLRFAKFSFPLEELTMAQPRRARLFRHLAVPALAAAVVALLPLARPTPQAAGATRWTPLSPVTVAYEQPAERGPTASGHLLAFNDFHGAIDPPTGSGGVVNGTPAGGSEYLATWVKRLRAQARQQTPHVFTVGAGDMVGASPLVSAAFHDEPSIEILNSLGLDFTSVGNHEFDEGTTELQRLQNGGCHPTDGCQDGDGFAGANFRYLAANVVNKNNGLPFMQPITIRWVGGVLVGFVGMTLKGTPQIVNPAGITTVDFKDEVDTANFYADILKRFLGIKAMVLLVHEGGQQNPPPPVLDPSSCANFAGAITPIVAGLRPEYGVVVSGHTHRFYSCQLPNSAGAPTVVTSAGANATLVTDIEMTVDRQTKKFAQVSAHNQIVENGIRQGTGWAKDANGNFLRNPDLVDPQVKAIADKYRTAVAPIANRVVGSITGDIVRDVPAGGSGESPLGDVIADGQLRYTQSAGAQIALMNPGGIRASLVAGQISGGEQPGQVTFGEAFTVQPFNNLVVTQTFTGAQLKAVLEQQFTLGLPQPRILQVSAGFTYSYDSTRAAGDRVSNLALNGVPIDPAATYRVTTNDFLANGGDGFSTLTAGTNRVTAPGFDVDALVAHITAGSPLSPPPLARITKLA